MAVEAVGVLDAEPPASPDEALRRRADALNLRTPDSSGTATMEQQVAVVAPVIEGCSSAEEVVMALDERGVLRRVMGMGRDARHLAYARAGQPGRTVPGGLVLRAVRGALAGDGAAVRAAGCAARGELAGPLPTSPRYFEPRTPLQAAQRVSGRGKRGG